MLRVFIGYDEIESAAWHTLAHSIYSYATKPVSLVPLNLNNLTGIYLREFDPRQSNTFSFSRFLIPYLCNFEGDAIFMDCDMLLTTDINEIFEQCRGIDHYGVHVVKHDYIPKNDTKYLGKIQYSYPRKNWSSFIYWNNKHPKNKILTPTKIRDESAAFLNRFSWLKDDEIGELNQTWNHLVGEYELPHTTPKNIHWTVGGPYFNEFKNTDYSDLWHSEYEKMINIFQNGTDLNE